MSILYSTHAGGQVPMSTDLLLKEGYLKESSTVFTGFANYIKADAVCSVAGGYWICNKHTMVHK